MGIRRKKKYASGEAQIYISRKQSMKKLQVSLPVFKRVCILKGIYPQEPKHRKRVGKGSTEPKVYYHVKDIQFLAHEPIIEKLRQLRTYMIKMKKAKEKKNDDKMHRLRANKPRYDLVPLVKERYPTKEDALKDMNDALNLIFLFARLPKMPVFNPGLLGLSRRLVVEFLNYVIATQALRKAFISIKGIYVQVEIDDIEITWIMPHDLGCYTPSDVDFKILSTCLEFDTTLVGSLLRKLYSEAGLLYPPKLSRDVEEDLAVHQDYCVKKEVAFEFLSSLTHPLKRIDDEFDEQTEEDVAELQAMDENFSDAMAKQIHIQKLQRLFKGKKFFLNREVPREIMCFLIRSLGGEVSWDPLCGPGSSFTEDDQKINYQIVDRPVCDSTKYLTRYYVQPQWVVDSVNACRLMPVQDYFPGVALPPHLSPFALASSLSGETAGYVPPEADYLRGLVSLEDIKKGLNNQSNQDSMEGIESDSGDEESTDNDDVDMESQSDDHSEKLSQPSKGKNNKPKAPPAMKVTPGKQEDEHSRFRKVEVSKNAERKLREMLIPKKHKELYKKMVYSQKRKDKEVKTMTEKRLAIEKTKSKKKH